MKCSLILLALAGSVLLAQGVSIPRFQSSNKQVTYDLLDDLRDFVDLIPSDEIMEIIFNNLGDPELQEVIAYIFSDACRQLVLDVEAIPEYKPVFEYLEGAGLPMTEWRDALHDFLGISRFAPKISRGLVDIGREIIAILPLDELEALYYSKLQTSPAFKELVDNIRSPVFLSLAKKIGELPESQRIKSSLISKGVPVEEVIAYLKNFFGITKALSSSRDLMDDLRDFIDLLPTDEILNIIMSNLDDPELQEVIAYIFSEDFKNLVLEIEAIPEYEAVVAYLESAGLPVRDWIKKLHDFLGISRRSTRVGSSKSLNDIINQIIAILPLDEIAALYKYKLENSPAFAELVSKLESPQFRALVDAIAKNPEVQKIAQELRNRGVPVDAFLELVKRIFGFQ